MPLYTNDIEVARTAYSTLEFRASAAESHAALLEERIATLESSRNESTVQRAAIAENYLSAVAANLNLNNQLATSPPDISLSAYIAHLGTAAAIAEAAMPDRAIPSLSSTVQAWLVFSGDEVGLKFSQPQDATSGFATTTIETAKVPPAAGGPSPRLITILQTKLAIYAQPAFAALRPAQDIIVAASDAASNVGTWTFASLAALAIRIATLEQTIAGSLGASKPAALVASYVAAAADAVNAATAISKHTLPVSADVLSLAAALQETSVAARALA